VKETKAGINVIFRKGIMINYLFLPDSVAEILKKHPLLEEYLGSPYKEGEPSSGFPEARKSPRQIYRILANQHYPHLVELLQALEYCLANGYQNPSLLQTRDQSQFSSSISELLIAKTLIQKGFTVRGFDHTKSQRSVPDILATTNEHSLIIEVYAPRDWEGLDLFLYEIDLYLKYLDRPLDFVFNIDNQLIHRFDKNGKLLHFDPWKFSDAMENRIFRRKSIKNIIDFIEENLVDGCEENLEAIFLYEDFNVKTSLSINRIQKSKQNYPDRRGTFSPPTLTGYAPEGMFDLLVRKRILNKLHQRQTDRMPGNYYRILMVDISHLGYVSEFEHPVYLSKFKQSLQCHLVANQIQADLILFCLPKVKSHDGLKIYLGYLNSDKYDGFLDAIWGNISDRIITNAES